ncbi:MAG: hypothetical protein ACFB00_00540 [Parvularculaceae bacterium]
MDRRWIGRVAGALALSVFIIATGARAGEEKKCAAQYGLEEQLILEWAALGGDPHAQFAIAQCAFPDGVDKFKTSELVYAVKWLTLAACDVRGGAYVPLRDQLTRKLKERGDLSFRRFGGLDGEEKWTRREKRFQEYRDIKSRELVSRYERLVETVDDELLERGRLGLSDELARLGPRGLQRLSELAECGDFDRSATFAAAAAAAAEQVWKSHELAGVYGDSMRDGWTFTSTREARFDGLDGDEKRAAGYETAALLKAEPARIERPEERAALGALQDLSLEALPSGRHEAPLEAAVSAPATTLIAQYALEALGLMTFNKGPDNDYGPATIEAAARAQARYGRPAPRWLTTADVRRMACDAARTEKDPVSFYLVGLMYARGQGFPADAARARYAVARAGAEMKRRLSKPRRLEEWKREAYPIIRRRIETAEAAIDVVWQATPPRAKKGYDDLSDDNLCAVDI